MPRPPMPPEVAAAYEVMAPAVRALLMAARAVIFEQARTLDAGPLNETLKWGEPAYLTQASRSGSTIRLGLCKGAAAALFNCNTTLVQGFRESFAEALRFDGKRAVYLDGADEVALAICFSRALTYHRDRKARR